jgi:4-alpha-glucanotransferase
LRRLAYAHGVQLSYTANDGRRVRTSTEGLVGVLEALGVLSQGRDDAAAQVDALERTSAPSPLEPVVVADRSGRVSSAVTVPPDPDLDRCEVTVTREDGSIQRRSLGALSVGRTAERVGLDLSSLRLPPGYHRLGVDVGRDRSADASVDALLLVPPPPSLPAARSFGVFAPLYALRGERDWGVGNYTDLARFADAAGGLGADLIGTLPMFPAYLTAPVDPSPYLPVSRLFRNELFVDVEALPEYAGSAAARTVAEDRGFQLSLAELRKLPLVDYAQVMTAKRRVMEICAAELLATDGCRRNDFENFVAGHPELSDYADFRAATERLDRRWPQWSGPPGRVPDGAVDPAARDYHRYAQFVATEQLDAAAESMPGQRAGLYLDLPVGVHPEGFDTFAHQDLFAAATVGAPPDRLAPQGQAWGFPPLHPQRVRADHYRYVIACYRHLLAHARAIRVDHILGLSRMFWIPAGGTPQAGAYVCYRREELLAILAIEAQRAGAVVVGEDLGTVPADIRRAMDHDGVLHSFVYQFSASEREPFPQPRSPSLASLGTHDLPRFAAFWQGLDIDDRVDRGVTTADDAAVEHADRQALVDAVEAPLADRSVGGAFRACIGSLASGPAPSVMVDLADIEGETEPDNRPGTGPEADNWRRRLGRPLGEIVADPVVRSTLAEIDRRRHVEPEGVSA